MDSRICQTFTATPAEPGGLLRGASHDNCRLDVISDDYGRVVADSEAVVYLAHVLDAFPSTEVRN